MTGRDRLVVSSAGFSVPSLPLGQGRKASEVGKIELNYACGLGPAKGENRLPGKTAPKQAFPLHFPNSLLANQQTWNGPSP